MNEPQLTTLPTIRHDGWTGEKMAIFCETLAENARASLDGGKAAQGMSLTPAPRARTRRSVNIGNFRAS